jgi:hypothetical protein
MPKKENEKLGFFISCCEYLKQLLSDPDFPVHC